MKVEEYFSELMWCHRGSGTRMVTAVAVCRRNSPGQQAAQAALETICRSGPAARLSCYPAVGSGRARRQ